MGLQHYRNHAIRSNQEVKICEDFLSRSDLTLALLADVLQVFICYSLVDDRKTDSKIVGRFFDRILNFGELRKTAK